MAWKCGVRGSRSSAVPRSDGRNRFSSTRSRDPCHRGGGDRGGEVALHPHLSSPAHTSSDSLSSPAGSSASDFLNRCRFYTPPRPGGQHGWGGRGRRGAKNPSAERNADRRRTKPSPPRRGDKGQSPPLAEGLQQGPSHQEEKRERYMDFAAVTPHLRKRRRQHNTTPHNIVLENGSRYEKKRKTKKNTKNTHGQPAHNAQWWLRTE